MTCPPELPLALVTLPAPTVRPSLPRSTTCPPLLVTLSARTMPCWLTIAASTSTRPPPARIWPRFTALPAGAATCTAMFGTPLSTSSIDLPAASTTWPSGALMMPSLLTPPGPASSITRPPLDVRSSPWLSIGAKPLPAPGAALKFRRWLTQSESEMFSVETTSEATLTRALAPKSTP